MSVFLNVKQTGGFVAYCEATWEEGGFNQQKSSKNEAMTAGTNWTVTLPDDAKKLHLHVEHDTGLVWKPRNVTGDRVWENPKTDFKNGSATIEVYGTTLLNYGLNWVDPPS